MKRTKTVLLALTVLLGMGGAIAKTSVLPCEYQTQYRLLNGFYVPAGEAGVDYICWDVPGVCTYYKPSPTGGYVPCQTGFYLSLH